MSEQQRAPGWYDDPSGPPGGQRWWNGISWGDQTRWASPASPYAAPPGAVPPARRGRSPVPWILGGCFALILLFLGGCGALFFVAFQATDGPRDAVGAYFADLEQGRYDAAAGRLCGRYAAVGAEGLRVAYPEGVLDASVGSVSRTNDTATVTVDLTIGSASAYPTTIEAVKEGDDWKVCTVPEQVPA